MLPKPPLTQASLIEAARTFCIQSHSYSDLFGVTDGKAVGTFIELKFQEYVALSYDFQRGNAALGIDLPSLNTDLKVTSSRQPQSSSPFRAARQKIYGLGYNLLILVYDKQDEHTLKVANLTFVSCVFIDARRTADYQITRGLLEILDRDANRDDILAFLEDRQLPGDERTYENLADEILLTRPLQGYLTISNALQWRLQYGRAVNLKQSVEGIDKIL